MKWKKMKGRRKREKEKKKENKKKKRKKFQVRVGPCWSLGGVSINGPNYMLNG